MRQSKLSNLFNFVCNRIETQWSFEPLNATRMQFENCIRVAIIFCNLAICWKQDKTEINELSKTIYSYYDLKVNSCNCGNLVWFCFKFLHVLLQIIIFFFGWMTRHAMHALHHGRRSSKWFGGAANFCPKNDLMHCVSLSKLRRFFLPKLRCSPKKKKKKVFPEIWTVFPVQMKVFSKKKKKKKRSSPKLRRYFGTSVPKYPDYLPK